LPLVSAADGALFALNALVETESVELLAGSVLEAMVPSPSGKGQQIARCPQCKVALWSNYYMGGLFDLIRFIRVGTLDEPDRLPPDVHIYTESKQPWVVIPPQDHAVTEYYDTLETWSQESLDRRDKLWLLHSQA